VADLLIGIFVKLFIFDPEILDIWLHMERVLMFISTRSVIVSVRPEQLQWGLFWASVTGFWKEKNLIQIIVLFIMF